MWTPVETMIGTTLMKGRFRVVEGKLELEWRGGRCTTHCGALKPDVVAVDCLKREALNAGAR
jgi:hypothetical protein